MNAATAIGVGPGAGTGADSAAHDKAGSVALPDFKDVPRDAASMLEAIRVHQAAAAKDMVQREAGREAVQGCEELIRWSALRFLARGSFVSSVGNGKSGFTCSCCAYQAARGALRYVG